MRIAILTNFREFNDAYSLTHVVRNQAVCLTRHGHEVTVFVREDCPAEWETATPYLFRVTPLIPVYNPINYYTMRDLTAEHARFAEKLSQILVARLSNFDLVITHDWILTSPALPLAESLRLCSRSLRRIPFLHWIHSIPVIPFDWWDIDRYGRNHRIAYPNNADKDQVGVLFGRDSNVVRVIPHIVDPRTYMDFSPDTWRLIDQFPSLLTASFVQIYPAAGDRLKNKGLRQLIFTFKALQAKGFSVACLVIDSHTGVCPREDSKRYQSIAARNGLDERTFSFMSLLAPQFADCTPRRVIRELTNIGNLFVFPTQGEAFGLVFPEACLAGGTLPILNRSLPTMIELSGANGLFCNFGSHDNQTKPANEVEHYKLIARMIIARAREDTTWQTRTHIRQRFNMDTIYREYYEPVLAESRLWIER